MTCRQHLRGKQTISDPISTIGKNSIEDVRVTLSEFKGKRLVDLLPELIAALEAASMQAQAQGWIMAVSA